MINTPIVLICFNRPNETAKIFNKIKLIKPKKLFLIMDGPRIGEQEDIINCLLVKNIVTNISWNCIVYKNFSKKNLGLKKRIVSGLNWVFSKTKSAIILEDDCLPNRDFFTFCQKLLIYYEKNNTVRFITGNNFQKSKHNKKTSYYFSKYSHIWGWATWKNTWELYCDDNRVWKKYLNSKEFCKTCPNYLERRYWKSMFNKVKSGKLKSWSIYLLFSIWKNSGLTATPSVNLVKNLGFNERGTNTKISTIKYNTKNLTLSKKLIHPKKIFQNSLVDNYVFENIYNENFKKKIIRLIKKVFNT